MSATTLCVSGGDVSNVWQRFGVSLERKLFVSGAVYSEAV